MFLYMTIPTGPFQLKLLILQTMRHFLAILHLKPTAHCLPLLHELEHTSYLTNISEQLFGNTQEY